MGGYDGPHKDFANCLDENVEDLPKHQSDDILGEFWGDNATKVGLTFKHNTGTLKWNMNHKVSEEASGLSHNFGDDSEMTFKCQGLLQKYKLKSDSWWVHTEFKEQSLLEGKALLNSYMRLQADRNNQNHKLGVGAVFRWDHFKFHLQLRHDAWDNHNVAWNSDWKKGNWRVSTHKCWNVQKGGLPCWNLLGGYADNTLSTFVQASKAGESDAWVDTVQLHAAYKQNDNWDYGVNVKQNLVTEERSGEAGLRWKLAEGTTHRVKIDNELNVGWVTSHKINSNVTMNFCVGSNTHLLKGMESDWSTKKGFLTYPFNFALRFKVNA